MPVRVLHLSASFPRSDTDVVAPFLADLVTAQRRAGWQASVIAAHDAGLPTAHHVGGVPVRRVRYGPDRSEVLVYRGGGHGSLRSPLHAALLPGLVAALTRAAHTEVRRTKPDVVHAHWLFPGGLVAALLPRRLARRFVLTVHGTDIELARGRVRPVARWIARRADAVLAVSEPLARQAEEVLGLPAGQVGIARLPHAVDLEAVPLPAHPPLRVLAAGRASREKGFDVLLDALRLPDAQRWQVTLVAEGPERNRLDVQAKASGLSDRVTFLALQPRAELFALMRSHHAVVIPSRTEGLGMVAVEALASGRPVIASATGGLVEVVADGLDGILVPPDNSAALAAALGRLPIEPPAAAAVARHDPVEVVAAHAVAYDVAVPAPAAAVASAR